jgi:hypothetical protein
MDIIMTTTLLDMPIEIIDAIIDKLPKTPQYTGMCRHDIKQLRLTCIYIETKTRRRFAQEFFSSLAPLLTPGGFDNVRHILDNETFRNSVRGIKLCFTRNVVEEHGPNDHKIQTTGDCDTGYILDGAFKSDFLALLDRANQVTKVSILSPRFSIHDTEDSEENMSCGWRILTLHALTAMATSQTLHLKEFALGSNEGLSIPVQDLASIPEASMIFSELTKLSLSGILENACGESPKILADLLARAPKLAKLDCHGDIFGYIKLDHIPNNPIHLPPLTELKLSKITMTEEVLVKGLESLHGTLHKLSLKNLEICAGTWKTVFESMRKTLRLHFLALGDLSRAHGDDAETDEPYQIFFTDTLRDRPVMLDFKLGGSVGTMWHDAIWMWHDPIWTRMEVGSLTRAVYQDEINDMDQLIADDWIWVAHHFDHQGYIVLDEEEGDDVMAWLAFVEERHQAG